LERKLSVTYEPIRPNIGARVVIERSALRKPSVAMECLGLLEEYLVLVFPRLGLTDKVFPVSTNGTDLRL